MDNSFPSFTANEVLLEAVDRRLLKEYMELEEGTRAKDHIRHLIKRGKYFLSKEYRNKIKNYRHLVKNSDPAHDVKKVHDEVMAWALDKDAPVKQATKNTFLKRQKRVSTSDTPTKPMTTKRFQPA